MAFRAFIPGSNGGFRDTGFDTLEQHDNRARPQFRKRTGQLSDAVPMRAAARIALFSVDRFRAEIDQITTEMLEIFKEVGTQLLTKCRAKRLARFAEQRRVAGVKERAAGRRRFADEQHVNTRRQVAAAEYFGLARTRRYFSSSLRRDESKTVMLFDR